MAVTSLKNQYQGINAHLQSQLQTVHGKWDAFHFKHINFLLVALQRQLRPLGYSAEVEQSLQIRRINQTPHYPESDLTIFDPDAQRAKLPYSPLAATVELVLPFTAILGLEDDLLKDYRAIGLYHKVADWRTAPGEPIVWIELLSPANKLIKQSYDDYYKKRLEVLQSGIVIVEIDYLHETPPPLKSFPSYTAAENGSHPYRISIMEPRPEFWHGKSYNRLFDVDEPLPTVNIPLSGADILPFDFDAPYQRTFEEPFYGDQVDYSQLPPHFETYSPADQTRILRRMLTVLEAAKQGTDLTQAPLPLAHPELTLEEGLEWIKQQA